MAVRLREADSMAAVAEMRQRIAELEIQVSWVAAGRGGQTWGPGPALTAGALALPAEGGGPHSGPAEPLRLVAVHPRAQGPD